MVRKLLRGSHQYHTNHEGETAVAVKQHREFSEKLERAGARWRLNRT